MNRNIVYPGAIPLDSDLLTISRDAMVAIGYLAQAVFGTSPVVDGLACQPTSPTSMQVNIGPGSITQFSVVDTIGYGSLGADAVSPLVKMGINLAPTSFVLGAPTTSGQSINYLIQASLQEADTNPVVLPFYNAANPAQPFSGPANSGSAQNTRRTQAVQMQMKAGPAGATGSQATPVIDNGWVGLYVISVTYGQTSVTGTSISIVPTAPFVSWKLPALRPGFGSGVQSFSTSSSFAVPQGVTQVEVELWGGGAGSFASVSGSPSGGGSGGGYARKRVDGLTPGQVVSVTVGAGGAGGTVSGGSAVPGGSSGFGNFASATGGALNYLATTTSPQNGATPPGTGVGGDVNLSGSAGQAGAANQGGMSGAAPMGGSQNSGTTGVAGIFPGGGASGAGTGSNGLTPYNGAPGAGGLVVVRW
jgi:hypothetical protein